MSKTNRPLSPHLQVYKPQLTSVLSIMHRMTGAALVVGSFVLIAWVLALALGAETYGLFVNFIRSWFGNVLLMGWAFCFYYHLANGLRHLYWDLGRGYDLPTTYRTGWIVLGASLCTTAATFYFFLFKG